MTTTHPNPEMIDPRNWCTHCGIHVANEIQGHATGVCPACMDDQRRSMRPREGEAPTTREGGHAIVVEGPMPRYSRDGGRTWHPLPLKVGLQSGGREELQGERVRFTVLDEISPSAAMEEAGHRLMEGLGEGLDEVRWLGGYPYAPRLHLGGRRNGARSLHGQQGDL